MNSGKLQQQVEAQILASYESLYRLAFTYVKNQDDAMDVVQESVCKAISTSSEVLDQRERTVIILRFFEDRKLQEIADIMDENLSTVKTILYRSLKKLKIHLTEEGGSPSERKPSGRAQAGI